MKWGLIILILLALTCIPSVLAQEQYHTTLLAVEDHGKGVLKGAAADLYLELREGSGRVFIDTFPLTKFDTQISTRFAKEVACDYLDVDCSGFDFIYTIKSDSNVVGGPSAGAATTLLTIGALQGIHLDKKIAMTGTINTGGFIGPVGGIKQKIEAANNKGLDVVMIPNGRRYVIESINHSINTTNSTASLPKNHTCSDENCSKSNSTIEETNTTQEVDLVAYGEEIGILVVEVGNLDKAWATFSREEYVDSNESVIIDSGYQGVMEELANLLCRRTNNLSKRIKSIDSLEGDNITEIRDLVANLSERSKGSFEVQDYYSSASFCFGANVQARQAIVRSEDFSNKELVKEVERLEGVINEFENEIDTRDISTIGDLETYMIVKERIREARMSLNESYQNFLKEEDFVPRLAYTYERAYSAYTWSKFFGLDTKTFQLDKKAIKESCIKKLGEVEERYQYVSLFLPTVGVQRTGLEGAYRDLKNEDFELCLFKASQAKAEVDIVLSVFGVEQDKIDQVIDEKNKISQKLINKQIEKGVFPILGYSYYEYGNVLRESDKYSALLYLEYALELGGLDIYFEDKVDAPLVDLSAPKQGIDPFVAAIAIITALLLGLMIGISIPRKPVPQEKPKKKSVKKKR